MAVVSQGAAPLASADQVAMEVEVLSLLDERAVQTVVQRVGDYWKQQAQPTAEHLAWFDVEFEQAVHCGLLDTVNADPKRPRVHAFGRFEHTTADLRFAGTKAGHPNPDYVYRFIPVDGEERYILHCRAVGELPEALEISLLNQKQEYVGNLSRHELVLDVDGGFRITIDATPAAGRNNHIQSRDDVRQVLIRDIHRDLRVQRPVQIEVERRGADGVGTRPGVATLAETCEGHLRKFVDDLLWVNKNLLFNRPANLFETPRVSNDGVWSNKQAYSAGHFELADETAMVLTLELGAAAYAVVPVSNVWGGLGRVLDRQTTLSTGCAAPNPDGTFTFVVAHSDPGVHNWVDPDGLHSGIMFIRWAGLNPSRSDRGGPSLSTTFTNLGELPAHLPDGVPVIDQRGRERLLEERRRDYLRVMG